MRPTIPDSLEDKLEAEVDEGIMFYQKAGYGSKSAFVAQAVKEKIEEEKSQFINDG